MASVVSWVQCNRCDKWRIVDNANMMDEDAAWFCEMNPNPFYNSCQKPEEVVDEVKSPKRYIQAAAKSHEQPQQPASKRAKVVTPEQELLSSLKTWSTEQIRVFWQTIDWGKILDLQRPHEPSLADFQGWTNVNDDAFVAELDASVRASLPPRIASQIPKLTSLRQQEQKLRNMLEEHHR
jgi:CW-type Zinc Finger